MLSTLQLELEFPMESKGFSFSLAYPCHRYLSKIYMNNTFFITGNTDRIYIACEANVYLLLVFFGHSKHLAIWAHRNDFRLAMLGETKEFLVACLKVMYRQNAGHRIQDFFFCGEVDVPFDIHANAEDIAW